MMTTIMFIKMFLLIMNLFIISLPIFNTLNPLNYIITFILFTMSILMYLYININKSLYLMIIFISLIGGMMIMFNYFISLLNNENSKINLFNFINNLILMLMMLFMFIMLFMFTPWFYINFNLKFNFNLNLLIYKTYLYPLNILLMMTMLFLIICMLMSFKMSTFKSMNLRKIKN